MPDSRQRTRGVTACFFIVALAGLFVWGGSVSLVPPSFDNPGNEAVVPTPDAYVGERVTLYGTVIATEPLVVRTTGADTSLDVTLRGTDADHVAGDEVIVVGTLRDDRTLAVDRVVDRDRVANHEVWEYWYLYGASLFGILWVLARVATQWCVDPETLSVVPCTDCFSDGESDG
ncbi:hypothetical protein G9464_02730 [Halostella sp. JP-L12]|uniref:hypothetical protein n=1 Tax=Halostella TaxID=1843185 RepID=UPI0013CED211|nr:MULTISPECIES: hypothetical protein [Halostella]NHN46512.1 hypothetical protein [Halostella sp. JP-L12]